LHGTHGRPHVWWRRATQHHVKDDHAVLKHDARIQMRARAYILRRSAPAAREAWRRPRRGRHRRQTEQQRQGRASACWILRVCEVCTVCASKDWIRHNGSMLRSGRSGSKRGPRRLYSVFNHCMQFPRVHSRTCATHMKYYLQVEIPFMNALACIRHFRASRARLIRLCVNA
jgi:hypothetical protein